MAFRKSPSPGSCILLLAASALVSSPAAGQTEAKSIPTIQATGNAEVSAKPDQAEVVVGVTSQAESAQKTAQANAQEVSAVISALRKALGSGARIETMSYSVSPTYRRSDGASPDQQISGYEATNLVRIELNDVAQAGKAIDAATQAGANRVHSLRFGLKDEQELEAQALREAATKARAEVEALANALGLEVVRVLSVTESGQPVRPFEANIAFAQRAAAPAPIEPSMVQAHASVTLTVEIRQPAAGNPAPGEKRAE